MAELATGRSRLESWLEAGLTAVFLAALLINLGNSLARSALDAAAIWADEAQQFALVWLAFLGAALATVQDNHLRMDVLRGRLPRGVKRIVTAVEAFLVPAICAFATLQSLKYLQQIASLGARSDMAGLPMWIPHAAVTLGFALMTVLEGVRLPRRFKGVQ
ncbi:TRAP transporter small permease [Roseateles sp.]|uniref:TRAP transporter small permease n=1 Tax=Roseateles sp. TaxID=1971397 RepID=UPI0039EBA20A